MVISRGNKKKRRSYRKVFSKSDKSNLSLSRLSIESLAFCLGGILLFAFLNKIPDRIQWSSILSSSGTDFVQGLYLVITSLFVFIAFALLILLILTCLVSLTASIWRFLQVIRLITRKARRKANQTISSRLRK